MTREELIDALKRIAHKAETSDMWTDVERLMPATGVADVIYEALDAIEGEPRTEIRVIELLKRIAGHDHQAAAIRILMNPPSCPFERLEAYADCLNEVANTDIQSWAHQALWCLRQEEETND